MSVLDSQWYPHITDLVLHYLVQHVAVIDPFSCFKLQAVCRAWQTSIKQRLFAHIVVTMLDEPSAYLVSTLPKSIKFNVRHVIPYIYSRNVSSLLPFARVLDLTGGIYPAIVRDITRATVLEMVRFQELSFATCWEALPFCPEITSVVLACGAHVDFVNRDGINASEGTPQVWTWHQVEALNVNCQRPAPRVLMRIRPAKLVLMYYSTPGKERDMMRALRACLSPVLATPHRNSETTVVVDLEEHCPHVILQNVAQYQALVQPWAQPWPHILQPPKITFVTHKQYREDVGAETYALHSMMLTREEQVHQTNKKRQ